MKADLIQKLFDRSLMDDLDFHNQIKDKNVIIILPGSNCLFLPDSGLFVDSFDKVIGVNNMYHLQPSHEKYLGTRLDYLSLNRNWGSGSRKQPTWSRIVRKESYHDPHKTGRYSNTQLIGTKALSLWDTWNREFYPYKGKAFYRLPPKLEELPRAIVGGKKRAGVGKKMHTGIFTLLYTILHRPKNIYLMGMNFHMYGTLMGYEGCGRVTGGLKREKESLLKRAEVCQDNKYGNNAGVDYRTLDCHGRYKHSEYHNWLTVKIMYNYLDNFEVDPMLEEILSMSEDEYVEANRANF